VVQVRDTGVGIDEKLLPRIFDLFTQVEQSLDRSHGGLGIGLALVKRLTELHGGRVEVASVVGQGSEFVVRLPIASPAPLVPLGAAQPPVPATAGGQPTPRPLRILVVDDNADALLSLAMLLRISGHEVRTAQDGVSALQMSREQVPDVVLLDIGLPGLNGYEVAKRVRQEPTLSGVVLVAITGYGQESDRRLAEQAGFDHHLVKPIDVARLEALLATISDRKA
jgi:CheY-like chemotaxis protein